VSPKARKRWKSRRMSRKSKISKKKIIESLPLRRANWASLTKARSLRKKMRRKREVRVRTPRWIKKKTIQKACPLSSQFGELRRWWPIESVVGSSATYTFLKN